MGEKNLPQYKIAQFRGSDIQVFHST